MAIIMKVLVLFLGFLTLSVSKISHEFEHPYLPRPRGFIPNPTEQNPQYWFNKAQATLEQKLRPSSTLNTKRAKNIILFLGDGMSIHTITATRAFLGDISKEISFEKFPYIGLSKTYNIDKRVPDSAATATAYLCGVKGNYGTIGVNAQVPRGDCHKANDTSTHTDSIAKWAQDAGKWTGLVTTARVTDASPAGVYAHTAERDWETDAKIEKDDCSAKRNVDIARQLVEWPVGRNLRVILGGGRRSFRDKNMKDETGEKGKRSDKRDLISEWLSDKQRQGVQAHYVWNKQGLNSLNINKTDYLMGLFHSSHLPYHGDLKRKRLEQNVPSLSEMTASAIQLLRKSSNGYFLFVEGAKIDKAHHGTKAHLALEETVEFAHAVDVAKAMTNQDETLIVVTSDHSHTMTINGYPYRGQNIFDLAPQTAEDLLPYTILSYANGPGYYTAFSSKSGRRDLSVANIDDPQHQFMATVPLDSETHGGEDVGVFATGPYAHYFTGNYEQTLIPALMAHAANIGPFKDNLL